MMEGTLCQVRPTRSICRELYLGPHQTSAVDLGGNILVGPPRSICGRSRRQHDTVMVMDVVGGGRSEMRTGVVQACSSCQSCVRMVMSS
jgi:hypothetical protein